MARLLAWVFLLTVLCSAGADAAAVCDQQQRGDKPQKTDAGQPPQANRFKWWSHPDSKKELGLTDKQSKKVDEIWETTAPKLRELWHELEKQEQALALTIKENTADVAIVSQQVEKVERLRAEHNATRTMMIYRMYLLLGPEQRVKVDAIRAKLEEERRQRQDAERKRQGKDKS
jgi:Spy/CpxP family protein refolding chaperone